MSLDGTGDLSETPDWAVYTGLHPPTACSCADPSSGNTTVYNSWASGNTSIATVTSGGTNTTSAWEGVGNGSTTATYSGNNLFLGGGSLICMAAEPETTFALAVSGKTYIFVGTDPNIITSNSYYASNGSGGNPQPTGGIFSAKSSLAGDSATVNQGPPPSAKFTTSTPTTKGTGRTLTFSYSLNGASTSQTQTVTARQFAYATNNMPSNTCDLAYGTDRTYVYTVYTEPDKQPVNSGDALDGTAVTETFSPALTCVTHTGNGALDASGEIEDHISSLCSNTPLTCSQTTTQTLKVAGFLVRTNQLVWGSTGVGLASQGPTQ